MKYYGEENNDDNHPAWLASDLLFFITSYINNERYLQSDAADMISKHLSVRKPNVKLVHTLDFEKTPKLSFHKPID